jgi:hypothetical protein
MTNIFAYTAIGATYPEFISVNTVDGADAPPGKDVSIQVRSSAYPDGMCGQSGAIEISREQAIELARAILERCE